MGLDPQTGELVSGGLEAQTERALRNLGAVLEAAGLGYADVVKTTCFLIDIGDFAAFNAVYGRLLPRAAAGPLDVRGRGAAQGGPRRGRGRRQAAGRLTRVRCDIGPMRRPFDTLRTATVQSPHPMGTFPPSATGGAARP